jgi:hypothetical protein
VLALAILFGAAFTTVVSMALGALLLRDACRDLGVRFVTGAGILSLAVFVISSAGLAYPLIFTSCGHTCLPLSRRVRPPVFETQSRAACRLRRLPLSTSSAWRRETKWRGAHLGL